MKVSLIQKVGDWTLDNPLTVLSAGAAWVGIVGGLYVGGFSGAVVGGLGGIALSALLTFAKPNDATLGPHQ